MPFYRYLDLSTAHITKRDSEKLAAWNRKHLTDLILRPHDYGWFVHVPSDKQELLDLFSFMRANDYSQSFIRLIRYAYNKGCHWINLDQDADQHPRLPTFNW